MEEKKALKEKKGKGDPDSGPSGSCPGGRPWGIFSSGNRSRQSRHPIRQTKVQTAKAAVMDITSELTASSSLSPKDTYEVHIPGGGRGIGGPV